MNHTNKPLYINMETGEPLSEKPESMTQLRGNLLVTKTHPQILLRGKLDTLAALFLQTQIMAQREELPLLAKELEELLQFVYQLLSAEVTEKPLTEIKLLGLDGSRLREASHEVKKYFGIEHPTPDASMGALFAQLNYLRTQVRETELAANGAFLKDGVCTRPDLIKGLNRLSSAVYILMCKKLSGAYKS